MKLNTFYNIYYRHRIVKAKFILKIYIFLSLPFSYLINLIYIPKIINLDQINKDKFTEFNLDMLLEYFGSDKAKEFLISTQNQHKEKKKNCWPWLF